MSAARILVVEDEPFTAMDEEAMLNSLGYEVVAVVASGEKAIQVVEENTLDLVLMDIKLAGKMDGKEATRRIRKIRDIPVIFMSALEDQAILNEGFLCVNKPFTKADLAQAVKKALR